MAGCRKLIQRCAKGSPQSRHLKRRTARAGATGADAHSEAAAAVFGGFGLGRRRLPGVSGARRQGDVGGGKERGDSGRGGGSPSAPALVEELVARAERVQSVDRVGRFPVVRRTLYGPCRGSKLIPRKEGRTSNVAVFSSGERGGVFRLRQRASVYDGVHLRRQPLRRRQCLDRQRTSEHLSLLPRPCQQRADLGRGPFQEARPRDADAEPRGRP